MLLLGFGGGGQSLLILEIVLRRLGSIRWWLLSHLGLVLRRMGWLFGSVLGHRGW